VRQLALEMTADAVPIVRPTDNRAKDHESVELF
jgi:hypothetical protein